jgi:hypothetical protein
MDVLHHRGLGAICVLRTYSFAVLSSRIAFLTVFLDKPSSRVICLIDSPLT